MPDYQPFAHYQQEIYAGASLGALPPFTTDLDALEATCRTSLDSKPFWFVAGHAGIGRTVAANRRAFDRWNVVPRMLRDVSVRDLRTTVFGQTLPAPVLLAPVGMQAIVHQKGELATACAAAKLNVPMVLSTSASRTIEEVADANGPGTRWFQLYWPHDENVTASLLKRARQAGYSVLVITVDTWTLGWRPRDLDQAYLPFADGVGTAIPFSDPAFLSGFAGSVEDNSSAALDHWRPMFNGKAHTWDEISVVRRLWDGPIVLKGIQHVDDARLAAGAGVDGIVVSNHGGRQVDGAVGSLDVLPDIAEAVGDKLTVFFDSGIRTGVDIIKALALGARAVLVGRPYVWGLALGGEEGVIHVVRTLLADLDISLGLCGYQSPSELGPASLRECYPAVSRE